MKNHRTIVVADHHKSVFVCQTLDRETGKIERKTLTSRRKELEPFLRGLAGPTLVYVEACRSWEWVSDLCDDIGVDLKLVNPARMPEIVNGGWFPQESGDLIWLRGSQADEGAAVEEGLVGIWLRSERDPGGSGSLRQRG